MKKGGVTVLFDTKGKEKKCLENLPIIRCAVGEKILCVQRHHPIVLIAPMLLPIMSALIVLSALIFIPRFLPETLPFSFNNPLLITYIILTITSMLFVIETYNFMNWYYDFYIITNKQIVHRRCFRIVGVYSESVYGEKMHVQDILRVPPNLLYDFLKIQDVYVYFHKLERDEPFIFETPENAQEIDDLIQDLATQENTKKGK